MLEVDVEILSAGLAELLLDALVAYMLEFERVQERIEERDPPPNVVHDGYDETQHRASSYALGRVKLGDNLDLVETFYIQPRLTDLGDTRLLSQSQLVVKVTKKVSITTSIYIAYDTVPPHDGTPVAVKKLDSALKTSLTYEF